MTFQPDELVQDIPFWIDRYSIESDFIMKVRPGASPGGTDISNQFAASNNLTTLDCDSMKMCKASRQAGIVFQPDAETVGTVTSCKSHRSASRSINRCSSRGRDVYAFVEFPFSSERRCPPCKARSDPAGCGPDRRSCFQNILVVTQGVHDFLLPDFFEACLDVQLA